MNSRDSISKRARPIVLVVAVLLATTFLYTVFYISHHPSLSGTKLLIPPANSPSERIINSAIDKFDKTRPPGNASDFHEKGDRTGKLADILTLLGEHGITKHERFETIIQEEFPWWTNASLQQFLTANSSASGMVMCVASKNMQMAGHLILSLRNVLGYKQPIQIAYAGDKDLPPKFQSALVKLSSNLELLNLFEHFNESIAGLEEGKYAMKPFAAIASRFQKTILVDADVIFLKSPDKIFEEYPSVTASGALFFHDIAYKSAGRTRKPWIKSLLGKKGPSPTLKKSLFWRQDLWQEMESGVVVFDKGHPRVMPSLLFSAWMNTKYIREKETYANILGDKETYWLATELSNTPYSFQPEYAGLIGTLNRVNDTAPGSTICSAHILHMDHSGETPFWFNGGMVLNKALGQQDLMAPTHYITGGATMADQPSWKYGGNEHWCAEGKPAIDLAEKNATNVIQQILKEAGKVAAALST